MGNEKAVNQLIAHHSIIFEPEKLRVWVSTSPWQLGPYVSYDLDKIFSMNGMKQDREIIDDSLTVAADPFLATDAFRNFVEFRKEGLILKSDGNVDLDQFIALNPNYYHTYVLAGDYSFRKKDFEKAKVYFEMALTKVVATKKEELYIQAQIEKCKKKKNS